MIRGDEGAAAWLKPDRETHEDEYEPKPVIVA
jgi:hypothetical protein